MSTRSSILYHHDPTSRIHIHVYEELISDTSQDIRLEIEFECGTINVPWPKGLLKEDVLKLAIKPAGDELS
jgi:hypothetical protein